MMRTTDRRRGVARRAAVTLLTVLLVAGCTGSSDDSGRDGAAVVPAALAEGQVLVGEVEGGRALVAIVHTAAGVTAYTCGFGEHLATHTGWFHGVPVDDGAHRTIPPLTSAAGLVLEGTIAGDQATGSLTLASGEVLSWQAEAPEQAGSGMFAAEDAASLAGLIVADDGQMVGSAALRLSPTAVAAPPKPTPAITTTTTRPVTTTTRPTLAVTTTTVPRVVVPTTAKPIPTTTTTTTKPTTTTAKPTTTTTAKPTTTTTRPTPTTTTTRPTAPPAGAPQTGSGPAQTALPGGPSLQPVRPPAQPPTGPGPVVVTHPVPGADDRTTELTPVTRPRTVTREGPTVVFLVHGMSDNLGTPNAGDPEDAVECAGPRNTPFYGRCEWGPDVLPALFGGAPGASLSSLAGQDLTGDRYIGDPGNRPTIDETLGLAVGADGCAADPLAEETHDERIAMHWVAPADAALAASPALPGPDGQVSLRVPPQLSVFTTWRDSTQGLAVSGQRLARQAYAATRWWEETYGLTPQIVFLTQSFGGLATRFVLGNPDQASLDAGNPDGVVLCPEDRARMNYLRDRTSYAVTLATPHEGSFLAEVGEPAKAFLRDALAELDQRLASGAASLPNHPLVRLLVAVEQALGATGSSTLLDGASQLTALGRAQIGQLIEVLQAPALRDLTLASMAQANTGFLAPDRARRTAGSPMVGAAGELIPLYATLARSPGDIAFDTPRLDEAFAVYETLRPKVRGWIFGTSILAETLVTQFSSAGWGRLDGPLAAHAGILDRRARLFDLVDQTRAIEAFLAEAAEGVLGDLAGYFTGQFGAGLDGVRTFLAEADVTVILPTLAVPLYLDQRWTMDLSGSVEVPMLALRCGGTEVVLDHEPLVRTLLLGFGTTTAAAGALVDRDLPALLEQAAALPGATADLLVDSLAWYVGKLTQLGSAAGEGCALPTDLSSDPAEAAGQLLAAGNIVNWRVAATTGRVPAPNLVPTGIPVADREQDTDGAVHAASALGLTLGREPFTFEHDRGGSWYRLPDEQVTEQHNHGLQYHADVGRWFHQRFLVAGVGPVPRPDGDSAWPE